MCQYCNFDVTRTQPLTREDERATFRLVPTIMHPCKAQFYLDGSTIEQYIGNDVGDIHPTGVSAGHLAIKAVRDNPSANLTVKVICNGEQPHESETKEINLSGTVVTVPSPPVSTSSSIDLWDLIKKIIRELFRLGFFPLTGALWLLLVLPSIIMDEKAIIRWLYNRWPATVRILLNKWAPGLFPRIN